jgi:3-phosphoshikimate 1-carboxyvinyltransferase
MTKMTQSAIQIQPISHPLAASVRVPGSKSLTNRALMVAALADGTTQLTNALFSDDSLYFVESLRRLGFTVHIEPVSGRKGSLPSMTVTGLRGRIPAARAELSIGNAGTVARFLTAMLTLGNGTYSVDGDARMRQRPMQDLVTALEQLGAEITRPDSEEQSSNAHTPAASLPFIVRARGLWGGRAEIAGNTSSQFLSGLLLTASYARHPVELVVVGGLSSKPFVDMTLAVMADFGVRAERDGYNRFFISPQCYFSPGTYAIECDATAASYFFAAAAVCGGTVRVEGTTRSSKQGDLAFLDVLSQMGCSVADGPEWVSVTCSPGSPGLSSLRGMTVDMRDMSDTAQTLAAVAPFASTPTTIHGIASARLKETDRVAAICTELTRLGVRVDEHPDGLTIYPCRDFRPAEIQTYNDHRMAMAFSLIGLKIPGISILDPGCVSKTFPGFFEVLARLQV